MGSRRGKDRSSSKDVTRRYERGDFDAASEVANPESEQRFSVTSKHSQENKTLRTTEMRAAADSTSQIDLDSLPLGQVAQVYSLFSQVEYAGKTWLCTVRKTMASVRDSQMVVGDLVRFRITPTPGDPEKCEGVVEQVLPRQTVLTRANSFNDAIQKPIVANAQQMLIVAAVRLPAVKWGLIDRMIVAARSGGLMPIVCLNKIDLLDAQETLDLPLKHYASIGIATLRTTVTGRVGVDQLGEMLKDRTTVLAGHSGVGKSSLLRALQPDLDIRIGEISQYTAKGRHTTTSARTYRLAIGGSVIDTPGVKHFGLWNLTKDALIEFFPDVEAQTAPPWRMESYERIKESLPSPQH